ncbi:hypothetical protein Ade02nite_81420 [Paractinoplanes deccanensis]|uniref:Ricin B lectin domain-containing protein n=1 Tax=Paractinoplanes deccanensis TaxID=113561 RepID=A0ABQ3YHM8_9ACTN|nr:hypothetical protein [Actinoplanes deccanensis]GID79501.1 hypothetical protein Ade02nite_81420 [Actinoplanes deccanensis]
MTGPRRDDRGSIALAMLVVLIGTLLSAILITTVIAQIKTGDTGARRVHALHAAQAGLEAGLAQVRAAVDYDSAGNVVTDDDNNRVGVLAKLPCGALAGTVAGAGTPSYTVTPRYYDSDPQSGTATEISCTAGRGPANTPAYVRFTAVGTSGAANRTLLGTYVVHTTNANTSGGLLRVYRANDTYRDLCVDAGSGTPAAGDVVELQTCSAGKVSQTWAYASTLQFVLVSSQVGSNALGMCLDGGATHAVGNLLTMQPCAADTAKTLYRQQWSFDDNANLLGSKTDSSNTDGYCLNVTSPNTVGSTIFLTNKNCGGGYNNVKTFSPDSNVGAGKASSAEGQGIGMLVNFNQFGRCLDVTGKNIDATFMIAWPCKQNPNIANVAWNQRYKLPALPSATDSKKNATAANKATGIITTTPGVTYCLQSPLSTAYGKYVTTKLCDGGADQQWTVYGRTDQYKTSYQIVDSTGYCLMPRDPNGTNPDLYQAVNKISKIYVGKCDGSTLQKWNADRNVIAALALKDINETS